MKIAVLCFRGIGESDIALCDLADHLSEYPDIEVTKFKLSKNVSRPSTYKKFRVGFDRCLTWNEAEFLKSLCILNTYDVVIVSGATDYRIKVDKHEPLYITLLMETKAKLFVYFSGDKKLVMHWWSKYLLDRAAGIIVSDKTKKSFFRSLYPKKKLKVPIHVIPYPVKPGTFSRFPIEEKYLKKMLRFSQLARASHGTRFRLFCHAASRARLELGVELYTSLLGYAAKNHKGYGICHRVLVTKKLDFFRDISLTGISVEDALKHIQCRTDWLYEDLGRHLKSVRFAVDFRTSFGEYYGLHYRALDALKHRTLSLVSHGYDICGGEGFLELDEDTDCLMMNKSSVKSAAETFKYAAEMSAEEYTKRLITLADYLESANDPAKSIPKFLDFLRGA